MMAVALKFSSFKSETAFPSRSKADIQISKDEPVPPNLTTSPVQGGIAASTINTSLKPAALAMPRVAVQIKARYKRHALKEETSKLSLSIKVINSSTRQLISGQFWDVKCTKARIKQSSPSKI
jgi:hypothetical protein